MHGPLPPPPQGPIILLSCAFHFHSGPITRTSGPSALPQECGSPPLSQECGSTGPSPVPGAGLVPWVSLVVKPPCGVLTYKEGGCSKGRVRANPVSEAVHLFYLQADSRDYEPPLSQVQLCFR